jgi:Pectinacetylesterase
MDETAHEPRGPDEDRRGQENDPTARGPLDRQLPPPDEDDDDEEIDEEHRAASRRGILSGRRLAAAAVAVAVLASGSAALALNGDGGGGEDDDDTASSSASADAAEWEKVVPGGECACADGSEFAFWVREAAPTKVVFFLDGAGACFDATTCAFTGDGENGYYDFNLSTEYPSGSGIFDFSRADNPFADYTFVYVPLCTGDLYLGDTTRAYSPELTVEHKGFVNGTAALSYLAEHYSDAAQVAVVGKTAGSVAAPVYGGLVADLVPDAQVTVFGAQSGSFPDDPDFTTEILGLWGAYDTMPDWEVNEGLTARDWGPTRFWIQAGLHDPDIVMARFDYAFDANAARTLESRGIDPSTALALIDANEATIEAAGVTQHSYTAPGDDHGIFDFEGFYELEVNGVTLVDWLEALLSGQPLDDVHCEDCEAP